MYITGLIDYIHYSKAFNSNVSPLEQEIYKPIFKCYAGKYFLGSAENHIDLAQLMVEHGLAKTTSCNFNNYPTAVRIFDDALDIYNWKVNKVA